jgi:hypothetical protein
VITLGTTQSHDDREESTMSDHDDRHEDDPNDDPIIAAMQEEVRKRFGNELDEAKLTATLAGICDACPDQEFIAKVREAPVGLMIWPLDDGWVYVGVEGLDPDQPTRRDVFGRFMPENVLTPKVPRPQG